MSLSLLVLLNVVYIVYVTVQNYLEKRRLKAIEAKKKIYEEQSQLKSIKKKADAEVGQPKIPIDITKPPMPIIVEEEEDKASDFSSKVAK